MFTLLTPGFPTIGWGSGDTSLVVNIGALIVVAIAALLAANSLRPKSR
jgi:hypothetical protein